MNPFLLWQNLIRPTPWPKQAVTLPALQLHRGYHKEGLQENTLQAFREARKKGARMCECDVRLSADDVPVIFHDANLSRLSGRPDEVSKLTASELKTHAHAPSLFEMLTDPLGPQSYNVELKSRSAADPLIRKVADVVKEAKSEHKIIFSSFNPFALWLMQDYLPEVPRALLVSEDEDPDNAWWLRKMIAAPLISIHMLNLNENMLSPQTIQYWRHKKMPLSAWTVNTPERAKQLWDADVASVITDLAPQEFAGARN